MGSQLTKNYEVEKEAKSEGGITGAWKIYSAFRRDRDRTPVSIFTFDKRLVERKPNKQEIINRLKTEVQNLIRLRHPNLLQILEPMMEDKTTIAWVTEPLEYCLGDLLRRPHILSNCLGDTETRLGILDLIQGLSFLHNEARLVHMALCPDNVYISLSGKWKIGGLNFAVTYAQDSPGKLENVDIVASAKSFRYQVEVDRIAPLLHFTSPEIVSKNSATPSSDLFSLGCSIYAIYKALSNTSSDLLLLEIEDFSPAGHMTACRNVGRAGNPAFTCLPESFPEVVSKMVSINPVDRGGLHELSVSRTLQTPYVKTIYYLEHLQEKQDAQKMQFFKGLTTIIAKFDKVIMFKRLLPALVNNMQHASLTPFILPSILTILKSCEVSKDMFQSQIWPSIHKLAVGKEIPAQSFYLILSEIDLLVKYTESEAFKKSLMPLVYKGYECAVPQIQSAVMDKTPSLIKELADLSFVRVNLLPRFLQGIINSKVAAVKESGLKALASIFSLFDRQTMVEIIIPSMEKFKKFDITGPMVLHLLTIYEGMSKVLGHKATSVNILPALLPLLVEAELSKSEFEKLFATMIAMMHLIKDARAGELTDARDEQIIDNLRNEEVEEVNDIFRDIFDNTSKPVMEAPSDAGMKIEANKPGDFKNDFSNINHVAKEIIQPKQEFQGPKIEPYKPNHNDSKNFDPLKGFSFNTEQNKNDLPKAAPTKIDPFTLDFGKNEAQKNDFKRNDQFIKSDVRKNDLSAINDHRKIDQYQSNNPKKDAFSGNFEFLEPQASFKPAPKPGPIIDDIFADFQKVKEENKVPKYNITMKPPQKIDDPKPGSLKPASRQPPSTTGINTDDFFNELLNSNPNKKDPFAGL